MPIAQSAFNDFAKNMSFDLANSATQGAASAAVGLLMNPYALGMAVVLIGVTVFLLFFLKKIISNSILGAIMWVLSIYIFHVQLPTIPSFVISILFGPAGIGAMIMLKFLGIIA